ncbi:MAG: hypothetical protein ACR2KL_11250 [Nocardioidaceae bacterium]
MSTTASSAPWLLRGMRVLQEPAVRAALAMPAPSARRLAGQPVTVDDKTLEPEIQLMLALQKAIGAPAVEDLPSVKASA